MNRALATGMCAVCAACAVPDGSPPVMPTSPSPPDAAIASRLVSEAPEGCPPDEPGAVPELAPGPATDLATAVAASEAPRAPAEVLAPDADVAEVWLKGSTHVHARASGDSSEPTAGVIEWYEQHRYDFIVLTDHNRVSELGPMFDTRGQIALRDPHAGLIVLSGIELTHNPVGCLPVGDPSRNCRIHVNLLGPTARPVGRIEWAERHSHYRLDMYHAAQLAQSALGGVAQINHPQWLWGMTSDLLVELAQRGMPLVEIANAAFSKWNAGDATHPSTEALWDAALVRGATLWATATDDAHDYHGHGKYPPGGGWVMVRARRDPRAILDALAAGRFYASTGVVLERAEVEGSELVVAIAPAAAGSYAGAGGNYTGAGGNYMGAGGNYMIEFIENGRRVDAIRGRSARRALPAAGYLRAVVTRDDGKRAWVQPARR